MVILGPWVACLIIGIILLVLAYNVTMPAPLNPICKAIGWIFVALAAILLILGVLGLSGLLFGPGGGLIVLGVILLVIGYNVPMPAPGNRVCILFGWIALILGIVVLLLDIFGLNLGGGIRNSAAPSMAAGLFVLGSMASAPHPAGAPGVVAAAEGDPHAGSDGNYKAKWTANVGVTILLVLVNIPAILEKIGWANLGIPDVIANWVLVISAVAALVSNIWFPSVLAPPTPPRLLAEKAVRGNPAAGHRLATLARANWKVKD